ncbi:hypothetical protein HMPREF0497_1014 [Lentilactobacillus buchneri ATCC 11577]|uniref:Uncharacterized protein n=1 Tax=Lentilactobacillus hilgardii (strain ATCC 8290 / DSM 20176 / CCUG 30140 / JCM 1155 / KCTC 3500 / NBRC 15886 / NCIMB 8040 / NRRL B-1843 / 9) TaxID=1423757 RepID=C0XMX0_LENH9|nr:hypothetical protein HMPREF0497_1014 [Lentilactobacillus buchneri ATCC 11577]EEI23273.1 hypothetical protein HMPREF0519_2581 [Lentilactobacillus hilgardii DSM 20176 = ATCC 8290]
MNRFNVVPKCVAFSELFCLPLFFKIDHLSQNENYLNAFIELV